jgi:hypothetical protein
MSPDGGCGKWMPVEYRMCAINMPERKRDMGGERGRVRGGVLYSLMALRIQVNPDGDCGKWMPVEYRMCAVNMPEPPERERDMWGERGRVRGGVLYSLMALRIQVNPDGGCGKWVPVDYGMCAVNMPEPPERERDMWGERGRVRGGVLYSLMALHIQVNPDGGCGKWMPVESRMCAVNMPEPPERDLDIGGEKG